jgi:ankyrin repeat protein
MVAGPARADKVLCDGNYLCLAVAVPALLAGAAIAELKKPPEKRAEDYIREGKISKLQEILRDNPALAGDPVKGQGLLAEAALAGNFAATQVLVKAGAAPSAKGSSALWIATSTEVIAYLIANGAVAADVDLARVTYNMGHPRLPEALAALLDARGVLDPNDAGALSLLADAALRRRSDIVKILLQRGVNPNGDARRVPLVMIMDGCAGRVASCESSSLDIARDLIASGADLKVIDDWTGCSVLQLARRRGLLALAKLLEEAGA